RLRPLMHMTRNLICAAYTATLFAILLPCACALQFPVAPLRGACLMQARAATSSGHWQPQAAGLTSPRVMPSRLFSGGTARYATPRSAPRRFGGCGSRGPGVRRALARGPRALSRWPGIWAVDTPPALAGDRALDRRGGRERAIRVPAGQCADRRRL